MAKWTIEDARGELAYIEKLCREGGDASVPQELVYQYAVMQARMILLAGTGREDFRGVSEAIQDAASAFLNREVAA